MEKKERKKWKPFAAASGILVVIVLVCAVYVLDYYHADTAALEAMQSDEKVVVEQVEDNLLVFMPKEPAAGLVFYPGGKVEYTAYAPLLHDLAEEGVLCVLCKMPCNLAVLDINAAEGIPERFPEVESWYIGGHSLGGSMAAAYVSGHGEDYRGLILLAAYSTEDISLSGLRVLSIYGSRDGVLDMGKYRENLDNLPPDTEEAVIKEGCHAQFGSYGAQKGDGTPGISAEEQWDATAGYILEMIEESSDV